MADKTSDTGLWLDDDSGKVVTKQPKGGATQLVRPGGRITQAAQIRIEATEADPNAPAVSAAEALGNPLEAAVDTADFERAADTAKPVRKATVKRS